MRPARMYPGIAPVQDAVRYRQSMRIGLAFGKSGDRDKLTAYGIILGETGYTGVRVRIAHHHPYCPVIPWQIMDPGIGAGDEHFGLPCRGIDPQDAAETKRGQI